MFTYIAILLLLAALAISPVAVGYWRRRSMELETAGQGNIRARKAAESKPVKKRTNYRAASVIPCKQACQAAIGARGRRVLLEDVPHLPLDSCDRIQDCSCTYEQHVDRRSGDDRRDHYGSLATGGSIGQDYTNQRSGMDRRANVDMDLDNIEFE